MADPKDEKAAQKKRPPMNEDDLTAWEDYFRDYDNAGNHRPDLTLMAGIGMMLVELVRQGR